MLNRIHLWRPSQLSHASLVLSSKFGLWKTNLTTTRPHPHTQLMLNNYLIDRVLTIQKGNLILFLELSGSNRSISIKIKSTFWLLSTVCCVFCEFIFWHIPRVGGVEDCTSLTIWQNIVPKAIQKQSVHLDQNQINLLTFISCSLCFLRILWHARSVGGVEDCTSLNIWQNRHFSLC